MTVEVNNVNNVINIRINVKKNNSTEKFYRNLSKFYFIIIGI